MPVGLSGFCPAVLVGMEEANKRNDPQMRMSKNGFLEAINSPFNDPSAEVKSFDQKDGHRVDVRVKYLKRRTEADVSTSADYCATGTTSPYFEENVVVNSYVQETIRLNQSDLERYCSSASDPESMNALPINREINKLIMSSMNALRTRHNRQIVTIMNTNFSPKVTSGSGSKDVRLLGTLATGSQSLSTPIMDGLQEVLFDYENAELVGKPLWIGFGNSSRYFASLGVSCCNETGFDAPKTSDQVYFYKDTLAPTVWGGANRFAVLAPGTVQYVNFAQNRLRQLINKEVGGIFYSVLPDPVVPGLTWDVQLAWNCAKYWDVTISTNGGLFVTPSDSFAYGDRLMPSQYGNVAVAGAFLYNALGA
jgi:hypothetical protein